MSAPTLQEVIDKLEAVKKESGNIPLYFCDADDIRWPPNLDYIKTLDADPSEEHRPKIKLVQFYIGL